MCSGVVLKRFGVFPRCRTVHPKKLVENLRQAETTAEAIRTTVVPISGVIRTTVVPISGVIGPTVVRIANATGPEYKIF